MTQNNNKYSVQEALIKFLVPQQLKNRLQALARERNISLSAMMRLIASDYLRRNQQT
jgi:predicted transcriptional regulator